MAVNSGYTTDGGITEGTTVCTKTFMQDGSLLEKLNEYVTTYNEEHKDDQDFIELKTWKKGKNGLPELNK